MIRKKCFPSNLTRYSRLALFSQLFHNYFFPEDL